MNDKLNINNYFEFIDEFEHKNVFNNIKYPYEIFSINRKYIDTIVNKDEVIIGEGTVVGENVTIEGPVIIGKNCKISSGAYIRPYTILGDYVVIGHCAEVKESIVFDEAKLQSFTFTGNSIIGKGARLGSGCITANRKFNQKNIGIKVNDVYTDFKVDFFGCVMGDYSRIGANSTTYPGSHIGFYTWILPMTPIKGIIEPLVMVKYSNDKYEYKKIEKQKLKR